MLLFHLNNYLHVHAGRPKKGTKNEDQQMINRTVKLPIAFWRKFEEKAASKGLTRHEALRIAALQFLYPESEFPDLYSEVADVKQS